MNLSNSARAALLLHSFLTRPGDLGPYVRDNLVRRAGSLDLGVPWFSYAAIRWLEGHLRPGMRVFEWGSGGSTVFFARHGARVVSVEDDPAWHGLVNGRLAALGLGDAVDVRLRPFDFHQPRGFPTSTYVREVDADPAGEGYDVIVVDGQDWDFQQRPVCFEAARRAVAPGGVIVVDDSWRYAALRASVGVSQPAARGDGGDGHRGPREVRTFQSPGPGRLGVTSTDVFQF